MDEINKKFLVKLQQLFAEYKAEMAAEKLAMNKELHVLLEHAQNDTDKGLLKGLLDKLKKI